MAASALPWVQAVSLPVIAIAGAWIAWQQMQIARTKLQHDLYERRFEVFTATRDLLFAYTKSESLNVSDSDLSAFAAGTLSAAFLFKSEATKRFLDEVEQKARLLQGNEALLRNTSVQNRKELAEESDECKKWLNGQIKRLPEVFAELALTRKARMSMLINILCYH